MHVEPKAVKFCFSRQQLLASDSCAHAMAVNGIGASAPAQCSFTVGLVCLVIMRDSVMSVVLRVP